MKGKLFSRTEIAALGWTDAATIERKRRPGFARQLDIQRKLHARYDAAKAASRPAICGCEG